MCALMGAFILITPFDIDYLMVRENHEPIFKTHEIGLALVIAGTAGMLMGATYAN